MEVWVVAASKYGSTSEIAEAISGELRDAGHRTRLLDAAGVGSFEGAGAVVLGSAVYAGRWRKHARHLLDRHGAELKGRPVWLFSSGPTGEPPIPEDAEPVDVAGAVEATGAREHRVFAGKLDRSVLKMRDRMLVNALKAQDGDFRDWEAIRAWARSIARELEDLG
ncbi:MAG: flavodoxin domain-containing protein [Solirubrobacterales bacterium]